jgi:hypothetical protein
VTIAYWDVVPIIAQAIPDFPASEDDLEDPLPYVFISDVVLFVCRRQLEFEMDRLAELLEKLLTEGDPEVTYLSMDAIETLGVTREGPIVAKRFGPKFLEIWATVYKIDPA